MRLFVFILRLFLSLPGSFSHVYAQGDTPRIQTLESKVSNLENELRNDGKAGLVLFLFGAFCALWAQNTRRNPWLWFFLGVFFIFITVICLLVKNSEDFEKNS